MFLVEGPRGTVLHTGDVRAETTFVELLMARTHLSTLSVQSSPLLDTSPQHVVPQGQTLCAASGSDLDSNQGSASPTAPSALPATATLAHLYLDTERLLDCAEPVSKTAAMVDTIQLLRLLPPSQRVHINCWTSGYESFLPALHRSFGDCVGKIHVDRYKAELYVIMEQDEDHGGLANIVSTDRADCGRFCACDDEECIASAIQIKPEEAMSVTAWRETRQRLRKQMQAAQRGKMEWPASLPLPLQRHSPLPELYRMAARLRPRRLTANTASASARFVLARISERLRLSPFCDEDMWQASCTLRRPDNEAHQWSILHSAWREAASSQDGELYSDAAFFDRIGRFRRLMYGLKHDIPQRLRFEMLDAEEEVPEQDRHAPQTTADKSDEPSNSSNATTVPHPWTEPGRYASIHSSPFRTQGMRSTNCSYAALHLSGSEVSRQLDPPAGQAELTIELASRYIAYAAMYLGWRIRNPSRYSQDVAWRAIRKLRPDLAKQTEEALQKELGWAIPPWSTAESTVPDNSAAISLADVPSTSAEKGTVGGPQDALAGQSVPLAESSPARPIADETAENAATTLEERLENEAESQNSLFQRFEDENTSLDHVRRHLQTNTVADASSALWDAMRERASCEEEHVCSSNLEDDIYFDAEQHLRNVIVPVPRRASGTALFQCIVQEWARAEASSSMESRNPVDGNWSHGKPRQRLAAQLTLVGAAARSRRARHALGWESVNFRLAFDALQIVCYGSTAARPQADRRKNRMSQGRRKPLQADLQIPNQQPPATRSPHASSMSGCAVPSGWPARTITVLRYLAQACAQTGVDPAADARPTCSSDATRGRDDDPASLHAAKRRCLALQGNRSVGAH